MSVDLSKTYKTKGGKRVIAMQIVPFNSAGNAVTFPVKGTIVVSEKPWRTRYQIWTVGGNASVLGDHPDDLVEVGEKA